MLSISGHHAATMSDAYEAMRCDDYHKVIASLHNVELPGAALLRARAWLGLERFDKALDECVHRFESSYEYHERLQLSGLAATAFLEIDDHKSALETIECAKGLAVESRSALLVAASHFCEADTLFYLGNVNAAQEAIDVSKRLLMTARSKAPLKPYHVDAIGLRLRIEDSQSWIHAFRGEYRSQEASLLSATTLVTHPDSLDRRVENRVLSNLAAYIYRWPSPMGHAFLLLRASSRNRAFTDESESRIRCGLENSERVFGFKTGAVPIGGRSAPSLFLRAKDCASTLLLGEWENRERFIAECRFAVSLLLEIGAVNVSGADANDILDLAAVLAPFDVLLARRTLDIHERHRLRKPKLHIHAHSPATKAQELFVEGCVAKAEGNVPVALSNFDASLKLGTFGDGDFIAAMTSLERYSISRDTSDLERARRFVKAFPRSSFSSRVRQALSRAHESESRDFPYLGLPLNEERGTKACPLA